MIYIGIDPGKDGALAIINREKIITIPYDKEKYREILEKYSNLKTECRCVVEHVHSMPNQGVKSTFNFGKNFGYIIGLIRGNKLKYCLVSPMKWKKYYNILGKGKQASIDLVLTQYKNINLKKTKRSTKDDDNIAEAILIAQYGKSLKKDDFHY